MGYNWRNSLSDYAQTSGTFAGFCFALIVFILSSPRTFPQVLFGISYAHVAVILTGIASVLCITATDLFLTARSYDLWSLPNGYSAYLKHGFEESKWQTMIKVADTKLRYYEKYGRHCYNVGTTFIFVGLWFVIEPFNFWVAMIVTGLGFVSQVWQFVKVRPA